MLNVKLKKDPSLAGNKLLQSYNLAILIFL